MYRNSTTVSSQLIFCNLSEEDRQMSRLNVTILMACTPFRKNVTNLDYQSAPLHSDIVKSILSYSIPSSAPHHNFLSNRQEQYKPHWMTLLWQSVQNVNVTLNEKYCGFHVNTLFHIYCDVIANCIVWRRTIIIHMTEHTFNMSNLRHLLFLYCSDC